MLVGQFCPLQRFQAFWDLLRLDRYCRFECKYLLALFDSETVVHAQQMHTTGNNRADKGRCMHLVIQRLAEVACLLVSFRGIWPVSSVQKTRRLTSVHLYPTNEFENFNADANQIYKCSKNNYQTFRKVELEVPSGMRNKLDDFNTKIPTTYMPVHVARRLSKSSSAVAHLVVLYGPYFEHNIFSIQYTPPTPDSVPRAGRGDL